MIAADKRWQHREERWCLPANGVFKPDLYDVDVLTTDKQARAFVEGQHYSASYPAARFRVGMFGPNKELVGVAVFSEPTHPKFVPKWTGMERSRGVELGRFVLLDSVKYNGETWFLARALKLLRDSAKGIEAVVSCADPMERTSIEGTLTKPAHYGTIYQASNALHVGRTKARFVYLAPNGTILNERMLCKVQNEERGWEYGYRRLALMGAPAREPHEDLASYVKRVLPGFRRLKHPGNIVYTFGLTKESTRKLAILHRKGLAFIKGGA